MSCTNTAAQAALEQLFTGELSDEELVTLRAHATTCEECRARYDRVTRVQAKLENAASALPANRMKFLEKQVLARVASSAAADPAASTPTWWERLRFVLLPAGGLALAGLLVAVVVPRTQARHEQPGSDWQARGVTPEARANSAFGVRAFCVTREADPQVHSEAAPGQSLQCAPGMAVQFTYTAPRDARLTISAPTADGAGLTFLPSNDPQAQVKAGSDQALAFSTVVTGEWLSTPVEVHARFQDPKSGELLAETTLQVVPEAASKTGTRRRH